MNARTNTARLLVATVISVLLAAGTAPAQTAHPCRAAAEGALAARGVAPARIADMFFVNSTTGGRENTRLDGYDAWAQVNDQRGSIVVRLDLRCGVREVYARDGATLPR